MGSRKYTAQAALDSYMMLKDGKAVEDAVKNSLINEVASMVPEGLGYDGTFTYWRAGVVGNYMIRYEYVLEDVDI